MYVWTWLKFIKLLKKIKQPFLLIWHGSAVISFIILIKWKKCIYEKMWHTSCILPFGRWFLHLPRCTLPLQQDQFLSTLGYWAVTPHKGLVIRWLHKMANQNPFSVSFIRGLLLLSISQCFYLLYFLVLFMNKWYFLEELWCPNHLNDWRL